MKDKRKLPDPALSLQARAHRAIPGGCHTYAKGDDQYPADAPDFIVRGKGCRVWDRTGREYIEYGMGLRAVTLGHAYEPVLEAAFAQARLGVNFNRPSTAISTSTSPTRPWRAGNSTHPVGSSSSTAWVTPERTTRNRP